MGKVYIVGIGPGSPKYLTDKAKEAIKGADVVVAWDESSSYELKTIERLTEGKKLYLQNGENFVKVYEEVAQEYRGKDTNIALIITGDPCISSGIKHLTRIFKEFDIEVISGISSVQIAAALARISLEESAVISFHYHGEVELEEKMKELLELFKRGRHIIALTGEVTPNEIAEYLMSKGVDGKTQVLVCENLTLSDEKIFRGTLNQIRDKKFSPLSVSVIINPKKQ